MIILYCLDIDECRNNIDGCTQNCTNTPGSYYCSCNIGYSLASDGHTCEGRMHTMIYYCCENHSSWLCTYH